MIGYTSLFASWIKRGEGASLLYSCKFYLYQSSRWAIVYM